MFGWNGTGLDAFTMYTFFVVAGCLLVHLIDVIKEEMRK